MKNVMKGNNQSNKTYCTPCDYNISLKPKIVSKTEQYQLSIEEAQHKQHIKSSVAVK